jgi:hypothetical protein
MKQFTLFMLLSASLFACGIGSNAKNKTAFAEKPPLKIIVIEDYSISQKKEYAISIYKMRELADSVAKYGGILSYGSIENNSNQPFTELFIEQMPLPPSAGDSKNPFKSKNKALRESEAKLYKETLKNIQTQNDNKIAEFLSIVQTRMKKGKKANNSDVHNCFTRANQLVCAPKSSFRQEPKTFVIACSDMLDDWVGGNRRRFEGFDCTVNPLLLVGAQGTGSIEIKQGEYLNLSSFDEAVRYVFAH